MTKIDKRRALKRLLNGQMVILCPSKLNPASAWKPGIVVESVENEKEFELLLNSFFAYNCNKETGRRINYWIDKEEGEA